METLKCEAKQSDFRVCLPVLECTLLRHSPEGMRPRALWGLVQSAVLFLVLPSRGVPRGLSLSSPPLDNPFWVLGCGAAAAKMLPWRLLWLLLEIQLLSQALSFPIWFLQICPLGFDIVRHRVEMVSPSSFTHWFIQQMFNNFLCATHNAKPLGNTWINNLSLLSSKVLRVSRDIQIQI